MKRLLVMAAGTGGHVIPGLAVATEMQRRGWHVSWLGTETGLENRLVPPTAIVLDRVAFNGLRGKGIFGNVVGVLRLFGAFYSCSRLISRRRPDAVLGMGGYICFPGGWMAWLHRKPLLLVNADATLLLSNRALRWAARRIAFGFAGESARVLGRKAVLTGNPVRAEIEALAEPTLRFAGRAGALRLLVVGGSLGARILNTTLPGALAQIPAALRPEVWHQAGRTGVDDARKAYAGAGVEARVEPFIDDVASAYRWADLVVARAGGITLAELAIVGVGAILVPFRAAIDDHQTRNAEHFTHGGAGLKIAEQDLTPGALAAALASCLGDFDRLVAFAEAARKEAHADAAEKLAAACVTAAEKGR
jgi:UDP-N-acetylglucosamine--N-acetylmuramyl-(pentapeptide) pyrophosphoryl-undecaprenol N-acetylglucosamine transferase